MAREYNIIPEIEGFVTECAPGFGKDFKRIPLNQEWPTMREAVAIEFLQAFSFIGQYSDEKNVDCLRSFFPIWQQRQSECFGGGNDFERQYVQTVTNINFSDLAVVAESQLCFYEWQDYLSKDTNIVAPSEDTLLHWRNMQRITARAVLES